MMFTRIVSRAKGKYLAEHLYLQRGTADDKIDALTRFLREYPEHRNCDLTLETYDSEINSDHYKACSSCGCVHIWD